MTPLTPPAIPIGMIDFEGEIVAGWCAAVTAQLAPLSIATVEEAHPQGDDEKVRQYKRGELPAIWVSVEADGVKLEACGMLGMVYSVRWGVLTEDADPKAAHTQHELIRQNVVALFASYQYQSNVTFLASGYPVSFDYDQTLGKATQADKSPFRTTSENEMRVTVFYPSPPME